MFYSAFSNIDGVNANIRTGTSVIPISDAKIRFERVSEIQGKNSQCLEDVRNISNYLSNFLFNYLSNYYYTNNY